MTGEVAAASPGLDTLVAAARTGALLQRATAKMPWEVKKAGLAFTSMPYSVSTTGSPVISYAATSL